MNTFILENPIWKVILNNNEEIISDNLYINNKSDWIRLKEYCLLNNLSINRMYISFRDNCIEISQNKHYFFRRMSLTTFGEIERENKTFQYFVVGSTDNINFIKLKKYLVPEMECQEEEERSLENEESLI